MQSNEKGCTDHYYNLCSLTTAYTFIPVSHPYWVPASASAFIDPYLDGYIIQLDYTAVKEQTAEIQKVGVNVNQIAKRVNSTGNAYKEDLEEIKGALDKIWQLQRYTLSKLR